MQAEDSTKNIVPSFDFDIQMIDVILQEKKFVMKSYACSFFFVRSQCVYDHELFLSFVKQMFF